MLSTFLSKRVFFLLCLCSFTCFSHTLKGQTTISLDLSKPGRIFNGMGGNFRLQNPKQDPKVIDYCLTHLRVDYGRVEMPWKDWHPQEQLNPMEQKLHKHVEESMLMAARLYKQGIPVILSCWFPPEWATTGEIDKVRSKWGVKAWRLNPAKQQQIYQSLVDYMEYARKHYGVVFSEFSFNESDLGIDVFFTPEQHAEFLKQFGTYLKKRGLKTKLLLGDNSNALSVDFIQPALNDPATYSFIGSVAFHSWDGCDKKTLSKWKEAATKLNKPLLVTEGSTDAQAWRSPEVFKQPEFAMKEINRYLDICNFCQPLSILQWQYTSDYSLLAGEGLCADKGPLRPTQRFWNIKQFGSTPRGLNFIPSVCSSKEFNCAAFAQRNGKKIAIHIVNNGEASETVIEGISTKARSLKAYLTNADSNMQSIPYTRNQTSLTIQIPAHSFVSILTEK